MPTPHSAVRPGVAMPSLVRWGVSADADLVYRALATIGAREAGTIARELGLPTSRIRHALDELTAVGAASRRSSGRSSDALWRAAPPAQVLERARRARMRRGAPVDPVARYAQVLRDAGVAVEDAVRPLARITLHGGLAATRRRVSELADVVSQEMLSIQPAPTFTRASVAAAVPRDNAMLTRGVNVAVVCTPTLDGDESAPQYRRMQERGGRTRYTDAPPLKLFIFDRMHAMIAADPLDSSQGMLEISDPERVASLTSLFRREWSTGRNPKPSGGPVVVLSTRDEDLIRLLIAGLTDDAAAKRLRVSSRTVTTIVRGLMDRVGADNRFQLGLALGAMASELPGLLPLAEPPVDGAGHGSRERIGGAPR